ncbi:MAG: prepilin-type N-terminal cleavage/methylation domain-containing protein [FCB group bacterium]|jgi:prepilin-type N-terminal cleavage/methylation domain-containing protein|nr:prepilin-type N-terminal cleavage/methylation domain-containing protein [FCB group bacterium]
MNKHARRGLTMVELIAALAVLSIGLMGAVSMYYYGIDTLKTTEEGRAAMTAARNEVEYLKSLPFEQLAAGASTPFHSTAGLEDLVNAQTIATVQDTDTPGLKEITAAVTWTGEHGRTITKRITTLVTDKGVL